MNLVGQSFGRYHILEQLGEGGWVDKKPTRPSPFGYLWRASRWRGLQIPAEQIKDTTQNANPSGFF